MLSTLIVSGLILAQPQPNPRETKVREDLRKVTDAGYWRYNDFEGAMAEAKSTGKPVVVVLRCVPCEECVKLDDEQVNNDPIIRPLLDQFVRVRIVGTNGLDLRVFQFDTDQSFAVFFLNADGTIYGRFGTRSHRTNWVGDVSVKGLSKALQGTLDLHKDFKNVRESLQAKRGPVPEFDTPELFPAHKGKFTSKLDYAGNVVKSCIHCHQIGDARLSYYHTEKKSIPDELIFPYPHPKSLGLILDPNERATVSEVGKESVAAKAGFKTGDRIQSLNGQPLLSIADMQWVLHRTPATGGTVAAKVIRDGQERLISLNLENGWRQSGDISWRVSTWGYRRMVLGGMILESDEQGLKVKNVGQYGPHATAKNAGVRAGDRLVSYDAKTFTTESALIHYALTQKKIKDTIKIELKRDGKEVKATIPIQE